MWGLFYTKQQHLQRSNCFSLSERGQRSFTVHFREEDYSQVETFKTAVICGTPFYHKISFTTFTFHIYEIGLRKDVLVN